MTERDRKGWIAKLPKLGETVTHRYRIAGKAQVPRTTEPVSAPAREADPGMVSERMRARMAARLAERGIRDRVVLDAIGAVPRHVFIDAALASRAYEDTALPIGHAQTISQPFVVARMLELMRAERTLDRVLEVGTGCGYQAAVLGRIARHVVSIERIRALHDLARENLRPLRIANVRLHYGDGREGYAPEGPYAGIVLAAAGDAVPAPLLEQLAVGGRLVAPVGAAGAVQRLILVERVTDRDWRRQEFDHVHFVPLRSGTT